MPTIGFTTTTFTDEPTALPGLEFAVENGFHALELSGNHFWPEVATAPELARLRDKSGRHGISLSIHFPTRFPLGSLDPSLRRTSIENLRATIAIGRKIGAGVVVVHAGDVGGSHTPTADITEAERAASREYVVDSLKSVASDAERAGVLVCLENLPFRPEFPVHSYAEQVDIVKRAGSPAVGLTLDVGHAFRSGGIVEAFRAFKPWLRHLHIHDATEAGAHMALGDGNIEFESHGAVLNDYSHTMVMEINVGGEGQTAPARGLTAPFLLQGREFLRGVVGNAV
ncbi:MAG: sugar phosphate isomerase/epimerase [Chloroflexi bacterium]|nr:sugar phosphate isomerase/epimerase [Chloroflexota bacterium]